jgi:hypothetical protein
MYILQLIYFELFISHTRLKKRVFHGEGGGVPWPFGGLPGVFATSLLSFISIVQESADIFSNPIGGPSKGQGGSQRHVVQTKTPPVSRRRFL